MSTAPSIPPADVAVLGGGLAGIAAAIRLAQVGARVVVVETSKRLGGRATSHTDPETGQTLDNCQHVVMGCCVNLLDLYRRLGVANLIEWSDEIHFLDKQGHHDRMGPGLWPAPIHMAGAFRRFGTLDSPAKKAIRNAMLTMIRMGHSGRGQLDDRTFTQWLKEQGQPDQAIERFWDVVVTSALNTRAAQASAAYAIQVFQEGFLAHRKAGQIGLPGVPLGRLYESAAAGIAKTGGTLLAGESVQGLRCDNGRVVGVELGNGTLLQADKVISALPFDRLDRILPESLRRTDGRLAGLGQFQHSPILGIHLWLDRAVTDLAHVVFVDSPLQWVFNKEHTEQDAARPAQSPDGCQYLHAVISAADEWVEKPADEIARMALAELACYFPKAKGANLVRFRVIKEKRATYRARPGLEPSRPSAAGPTSNLYLAGDWTATGWPATMEGAVRSGYLAAGQALGRGRTLLARDLPHSWLYRLLGGGR